MNLLGAPAYAWRRGREWIYDLRGRRMVRRYSAHYRDAQRHYQSVAGHAAAAGWVHDLGVEVLQPGEPASRLTLPEGFSGHVARVAAEVDEALAVTRNCRFVPALRTSPVPERSSDVAELNDGRILALQLRNPLALESLDGLCTPLTEELEQRLFGCFTIVDKVYVYRTPVSHVTPSASWTWHFDNHPREVVKVLVYLTDVGSGQAPFEYLTRADGQRPVPGGPLTPLFGDGRVSAQAIADLTAAGCEARAVTGPRGTAIVFDNNVIHRATKARSGHRDVLVLQIRPSITPQSRRIDERWTGSFAHWDINRNPADYSAHRNPHRH